MRDGTPISWRHFVYGLSHLSRAYARESIREFHAFGMTQAKPNDRNRWLSAKKSEAGWS